MHFGKQIDLFVGFYAFVCLNRTYLEVFVPSSKYRSAVEQTVVSSVLSFYYHQFI